MNNMTENQIKFADEYIRTGNSTQSYLNSYTNVKKETTAATNGSRLLRNANVKAYIDDRLEELRKESIAEQDEILQFLTSVVRGEAKGKLKLGIGGGAEVVEDVEPALVERIRAAEQLGKRYGMWTDRQEMELKLPTFIDDVVDSDE